MAKALRPDDRVKVTFPGHTHADKFGNVQSVERTGDMPVARVLLDGETEHRAIYEADLTKVPAHAGKPKPGPVVLTSEEKMYMLGSLALVMLRENPDPQEFTAKMYLTASEMGEL